MSTTESPSVVSRAAYDEMAAAYAVARRALTRISGEPDAAERRHPVDNLPHAAALARRTIRDGDDLAFAAMALAAETPA